MFGLAVLLAFGLYLLVSFAVVRWAIRYARKKGKSAKRWGWGAALVMYSLVFWDWIPTVATHQYYCAKDSGFWVYKTLEQWKTENPGVMETLVANKGARSVRDGDMENYTDTYPLNQRISWVVKHNGQFLFNRWRHEQSVVDGKTGLVLARYVDFSTSQILRQAGWSGWKFWLDSRHCRDGATNKSRLLHFVHDMENLTKQGVK